MGSRILDPKLMSKLAKRLRKRKLTEVNVLVSKKAARLGISSEAALIILAKEQGIGTSTFQRKIDPVKQGEVRDSLPTLIAKSADVRVVSKSTRARGAVVSPKKSLKAAIEYLIEDSELRDRCQDLLLARSKFDRAINQATLVLEDRIRKKSEPEKRLVSDGLVGFSFNEDLVKTRLRVATNDPDDQRGFTQILRGIVPAFRHKTHHHLIDDLSRQDALRVCGFVDVLLRVVDKCSKTQ